MVIKLFSIIFLIFSCQKSTSKPDTSSEGQNNGEVVLSSEEAKKSKVNSEILSELLRVVLLDKNPQRSSFFSYVENMNQGASIEGIYNGVTRSDVYRKLEISNPGSLPATLRVFGEELQKIQQAMPAATTFEVSMTEPLPLPQHPGGVEAFTQKPPPETIVFDGEKPQDDQKTWSAQQYAKFFVGSSYFTLKRVLSDEVLKLINVKSFDKTLLAKWYGEWVNSLASHQMDFGLELRNKSDAKYHEKWATEVELDLIKWESLNRVQRILNHYEKKSF
jgi:hypothetical protein